MLKGTIKSITALTTAEKERMFVLLSRHFDHCCLRRFTADLAEKEGAILLCDESGEICGFSTYLFYAFDFRGRPLTVLFSGDTIIARQYWGDSVLFREFLKLLQGKMTQLAGEAFYWFLISKGIRTYLLLPLFFREFYPHPRGHHRPEAGKILRQLGLARFGAAFDAERGVIASQGDCLCSELAEIPAAKLNNQYVRFFLSRNEHWRRGDELACLTEISPGNFKPTVGRLVASLERE